MVRTHHLPHPLPSRRHLPPIRHRLQPVHRRRRSHHPPPRPETAFLRNIFKHRRQRSLLGPPLRSFRSPELHPLATRSPSRLRRIPSLGTLPPPVFLRRLRR